MPKTTEITRHQVSFAGSGARTGPLTWGQLEMWDEAQKSQEGVPTFANMLGGCPLPPGLPIQRVVEALASLVERHESLRTRYRSGSDGEPVQQVVAEGVVDIEVLEVDRELTMTDIVGEWYPIIDLPYDLAEGLPFRARVGTVDGEPVFVMYGMSHLSSDYLGTQVLQEELLDLLADRALSDSPAMPPLELAARENSEEGRRVLDRALDHWRKQLAAAPSTMFPQESGVPEQPRFWRGGIRSQVAARALEQAAERSGVGTSYILLGAMSVLVGRYSGLDRCSIRSVAGNRGRPELRRAVGNLSQETPLVVDLDAEVLHEVLENARGAFLWAQRNGRYDPRRLPGLLGEYGVELDVCFNDLWTPTRSGRTKRDAPPAETTFEWEEKVDRATVVFYLEAFDVFEDPDAIHLSLFADTGYVPPNTIRAFLDALEHLLVVLADHDIRLDEIEPVS